MNVDSFETNSSGLGDVHISLLVPFPFFSGETHSLAAGLGASLPAGSIDHEGLPPVPPPQQNRILPYPMQIGSGTFDLLPGLTYFFMVNDYSIGLQVRGVIRLNQNERDYKLGDRILATGWFSYIFALWVSGSFRVEWQTWGNIDGSDAEIARSSPMGPPRSVPTAQPDLLGGGHLNLFLGLNLYPIREAASDLRFAIEVGYTIYQDLDGPQLGRDWVVTVGVQSLAFDFF